MASSLVASGWPQHQRRAQAGRSYQDTDGKTLRDVGHRHLTSQPTPRARVATARAIASSIATGPNSHLACGLCVLVKVGH
jgi:hypothetical protein